MVLTLKQKEIAQKAYHPKIKITPLLQLRCRKDSLTGSLGCIKSKLDWLRQVGKLTKKRKDRIHQIQAIIHYNLDLINSKITELKEASPDYKK